MIRPLLTALAMASLAGCHYAVVSPPASAASLESPAVLARGRTGVQISGSLHAEPLGATIAGGSARVRHGVTDRIELSGEGTILAIQHDQEDVDASPRIYALRAGLKYSVIEHFAVTFGVGGGGHAAGGFFSPDVGFIVGYENQYVVPFLSARLLLSIPIASDEVFLGEDQGVPIFDEPELTLGSSVSAGLRVPLDRNSDGVGGSLLGAFVWTFVDDGREASPDHDSAMHFMGAVAGAELTF